MLKELTITIRRLKKRPSFTLPAIATLAVGVGATTAIFTIVNATLLRPLPYPQAEDIYTLNTTFVDGRWTNGRVSGTYIAAINESAPSVTRAVAVSDGEDVIIADDGRNRKVLTHYVTEGFFDLVGLPMAAGRAFAREDYSRGGPYIAVLSFRIWDQMFGRDPEVVGRALRLATGPVTVVGIAPPDLDIPRGTDVWFTFTNGGLAHNFQAFLRVEPGTDPERLRSELATVMAGLAETYPQAASGRAFVTKPLVNAIVGDLGPILLVVLAGAVVLLTLGCVNVATLMLARGGAQTREFAVRKAFGANQSTILRQLLTESFVLSSVGTVMGLFLAFAGVRLLLAFGASGLPRLDRVPFDGSVFLFAATALVGITLLVGLLPAVRLATPDIRGLLGHGGRSTTDGRGSNRLLSGLVVAEIALAITLVAGAGWLVRSYVNLSETDPGFTPEGRLVFEVLLTGSTYDPMPEVIQTPDGRRLVWDSLAATPRMWLEELTERLKASGQIDAVGVATTFPLGIDWDGSDRVSVLSEPYDPSSQGGARRRWVSPGFFEAMGIRLIAGRTFTQDDLRARDRPAIVNQAFVRRYLAGKDPLTESFASGYPLVNFDVVVPIIGVVADVRYSSLREPAEPIYYFIRYPARGTVVVSTSLADATPLIPTVLAGVNALDPSIPVTIETLDAILSSELVRHRLGLILMTLFATLSLALAGIGIYGVIGHLTSQRSGEFAVRMALGANPSSIIKLVMRQGRTLAVVGMVMGVGAAYAGGRLATSWLYEVRASDPLILIVSASTVVAFTLLAFLVPAFWGSRIRPAQMLRMD